MSNDKTEAAGKKQRVGSLIRANTGPPMEFDKKIIGDLKLLDFHPMFNGPMSHERVTIKLYHSGKYNVKDISAMYLSEDGWRYILYNREGFFSKMPWEETSTRTGGEINMREMVMFATNARWVGRKLGEDLPPYIKYSIDVLWKTLNEARSDLVKDDLNDFEI